jgi:hypothetical protein
LIEQDPKLSKLIKQVQLFKQGGKLIKQTTCFLKSFFEDTSALFKYFLV